MAVQDGRALFASDVSAVTVKQSLGTLLITGASGLLGSNLCFHFRERWRIVGLYCQNPLYMEEVEGCSVDLLDFRTLDAIGDIVPDVVIHMAAHANVDSCEANPSEARRLNVGATRHLRHLWPDAYFVYVSTDSVYGQGKGPHQEDGELCPLSVYAQTKLEGEAAAMEIPARTSVLRTCIYGVNYQTKESLAEWMWNRLSSGEGFDGFTDVYFSPILVNDLARVLEAVIERPLKGTYNVGSVEGCSKFHFGRRLAKLGRFDPALARPKQGGALQLRAPRPLSPLMDVEKVQQALGKSMPSVEAGLESFCALLQGGYQERLRGSRS